MSARDVAEQVALLCTGTIGLITGTPPPAMGVVVPLVKLFRIGHDLRQRGVDRTFRTASAAAAETLSASHDFTPADLDRAKGLLEGLSLKTTLHPGDLHTAAAMGVDGFDRALAEHVIRVIPFEADDTGAREVIRLAVEAGFAACNRDPDYREGLTQALVIEVARAQGVALKTIQQNDRTNQRIEATLDDISELTRDALEGLALRFGMAEPETMSPGELRGFLFEKAKDYKRLLVQVQALEDQDERITSLKFAAEQAVIEFRLDDARKLIREARAIQRAERTLPVLKEQAALAEAEAQIALLEGDTDEACRILTSSAASFGQFDREEMLRRYQQTWETLHEHGERYGGAGLLRAIEIMRQVIPGLNEQKEKRACACMQGSLGLSLRSQGARTTGREAVALLAEAAEAHRAAAQAFLKVGTALNVAIEQNALGGALRMQSERTDGESRAALLRQAVAAYRTIPSTVSQDKEPEICAKARMNLGVALQRLSTITPDPEGLELIEEARTAGYEAIGAFKALELDEDWAKAQIVLGNTLAVYGARMEGEQKRKIIREAVEAQEAPLRIYKTGEYPLAWALTQMNLATKLGELGDMTPGTEGMALLRRAEEALHMALNVYTEIEMPRDWAVSKYNLGTLYGVVARHDTCLDPKAALKMAEGCYAAALRVYDPVHMARDHRMVTEVLTAVREQLSVL